jgi:antitoxin YqcF
MENAVPDKKRIPTADEKIVAKHLAMIVGGKPVVYDLFHDSLDLSLGILMSADQPAEGVTSYGTIGLLNTPMSWGKEEYPTRLELVGACRSEEKLFPNILGSAAFNIMRSKKLCSPGTVMPGYVAEYLPDCVLPHLYFTEPFVWPDLDTIEVGSKKVSWLLAIPISETERVYIEKNGDDKFEDLLEKNGVNIFELRRPSVL